MQQGRQKQLSTDVETWPTNFTHNFTLCGNISGTKRKANEWVYLGEPFNRVLFALTVCGCVCVCRVVPYLLFSSASCCYSGRLFALLFLPLSLMLTSNGVGKNPIRRRMCRVWRFKNHRSLFFHSFVCECVSFSFPFAGLRRSGVEGEGQGKCVSIVALRMNHAHFKLIYSTVAF